MRRLGYVLLFGAFGSLPLLTAHLQPNAYAGGRSRDVGDSAERNTSALAAMLGEFRTAISDVLYIKTERYLHSGIAYVPHLEKETLATAGMIAEIDEHHGDASMPGRRVVEEHAHREEPVKTLVPAREDDFRGFIGQLHRKVKPWQDPSKPHLLTDGREMLPWFRIMTLSDPRYIRGYAVGGWWLQRRNLEAALRFLEEGVSNNPTSFEVHYTLGGLRMEQGKNANNGSMFNPNPSALPYFLLARDAYVRAADLAAQQRPVGWIPSTNDVSGWTDYMEEDALGASRMAAMTEQNYGDRSRAMALALRYRACFGTNAVLDRIARGELSDR